MAGRRPVARHIRIMRRRLLVPLLLAAFLPGAPLLAAEPLHAPQCAGVHKAEEGAERAQGPWSVSCFQGGTRVFREEALHAYCRLVDGRWRFQGWWQHESGQAVIVPDSPSSLCVWRQEPPPQPKR